MLEDENNDRDRDVGGDSGKDLGVHLRYTSVLEATRYLAEELELRLLRILDMAVGDIADHDVQEDDKSHAKGVDL